MTTIRGKAGISYGSSAGGLKVEDVNFDPPRAGEVRVQVKATGLCHSDVNALKRNNCGGIDFSKIYGPVILGHEGAGIVESVGQGVSKVKPGDHVIILWIPQCNDCFICNAKPKANFCLKKDFVSSLVRRDGTSRIRTVANDTPLLTYAGAATFAEYTIVEEIHLCKIPTSIPFDVAALVGCCFGTGYGSAQNIAKVTKDSVCAVWGLGAVGLSTIIGCKAAGAKKIYAIDRLADKAELAYELGATDFLNATDLTDEELLAEVRGVTGVDYAFECTGVPVCMELAKKSLADWGNLTLVGLQPNGTQMTIGSEKLVLGQTVTGGFYGRYKPLDGIGIICREIQEGLLDSVQKLVTHRLPLEKINEGFELLETGKTIRTVIEF